MPVSFLSDAERDRLSHCPAEIDDADIVTYFTLSDADVVQVRTVNTDSHRLGFALQLGLVRYLGFVPTELAVPEAVVGYVAAQLDVAPTLLADYGQRRHTRSDHARLAATYLDWRAMSTADDGVLAEWLTARALEHDRPTVLFGLATDRLRQEKIVRPGISRLERAVAAARERAFDETYRRLAAVLTPQCCAFLDTLLVADAKVNSTRLEWLRQEAVANTANAILTNIEKLTYLRTAGVAAWRSADLHPNRRKFLAHLAHKSTVYVISRMVPQRRYPLLLAYVIQALEAITDETLDLVIRTLADASSRAKNDLDAFRLDEAAATERKLHHFQTLCTVFAHQHFDVPDIVAFYATGKTRKVQ